MEIKLRNESKEIACNAMIDSLILIRSLKRKSKLHNNYLCIETLLCELEKILLTNAFFNADQCSTSSNKNLTFDLLSDEVKIFKVLNKQNIIFIK